VVLVEFRKERDALGEVSVPKDAYWGISTQRAVRNFQISGKRFPEPFIMALARVKKACVEASLEVGSLDDVRAKAIIQAVDELLEERKHLDQFPLDVYQTGSGTQVNMNMNEVLANRANEILGYPLGRKSPVHPNDHVNKNQSSNDVVPTAMHLSALELMDSKLFPALEGLRKSLLQKTLEFKDVVKVGRTHLQDAVPIRLSTEFKVYLRQVELSLLRLKRARDELCYVPIGGTAVGTGLGADRGFDRTAISNLRGITGFPFRLNPVKAEGIASHSAIVKASGELRLLALSVLKMANDVRLMASGPRAGLGELTIPVNEPGSSIMPGKVNPTQAEALVQVCIQIAGNDATISFAEAFGSTLDLNVSKPLMIVRLLESIELLANGITSFVENCLKGLRANVTRIESQLEGDLMVVTSLVPLIGYDVAAEIAQTAARTGKTIKQVVLERRIRLKGDLDKILDPKRMA
jgi:fumarate hydratase class II